MNRSNNSILNFRPHTGGIIHANSPRILAVDDNKKLPMLSAQIPAFMSDGKQKIQSAFNKYKTTVQHI